MPLNLARSPRLLRLTQHAQVAGLVARTVLRRAVHGPGHPSWSFPFELTMGFLRAMIEVDYMAAARGQRKRPSFVPPHLLRKVRVSFERLNGVRCEVHTPTGFQRGDGTLLYLHGGGYVTCSPASHRHVLAALAHLTGARVYAPDYRLAPEQPFPAAVEDVTFCYRALLARGIAPEQLVLAGDSAGGGLAVALALCARDQGLPRSRALVLLSPWVDLTLDESALLPHAEHDYLRPRMLVDTARQYAAGERLDHPLISPIYGDLSQLPDTLLVTGSLEIFHEQNCRFVERAEQHGVSIEHLVEPGMLHAFPAFSALTRQGRVALHAIARYVRERVGRLPAQPLSSSSSVIARKSA